MIKIVHKDKYIEVSSPIVCSHELMLFYCTWQYKIWPAWMDYKFDSSGSANSAYVQHKNVLNSITDKGNILLSINGRPFIDAYEYAVKFIKSLNITVEEYEYQTVQVLTLINK